MTPGFLAIVCGFAYLAALFAIAHLAGRRADRGRSVIANSTVYALSLGVYCTTWTFYGSVGRAAATGIGFLPIYLGPTLLFALGGFVIHKIVRIAKDNRITSIADFIASRYGKSQLLGGLVTIIAVVGVVPYIALQLKAVSSSFTLLSNYPEVRLQAAGAVPLLQDSAFYVAAIMAGFTILYGTRHLDAAERHEGMVAAIAFESIIKLLTFLAAGLYVTFIVYDGFGDIFTRAAALPRLADLQNVIGVKGYGSWTTLTFLSMLAVLLLPRQFQIIVVENVNPAHIRRAVWLFPAYLLAINLFVLPIALGGALEMPAGVEADTYVLTLPMAHHQEWLSILVFIGGLSAATGMVIVETIALSTMVCNDLIMPLLLRVSHGRLSAAADLSGLLLGIRRWSIAIILMLGYLYFRLAGEAYALVSIGLISFAAVAQFAPALIGGLYWHGGTRPGALAGLSAGFGMWLYTLLLPSFAKSGWLPAEFLSQGPWGIELLRPQQLFGLTGLDEISHCLVWSLSANLFAFVAVSLLRVPDAREARQAALFVSPHRDAASLGAYGWRGNANVMDLMPLASRFLGPERAHEAFLRYARSQGLENIQQLKADGKLIHFVETQLAGAIGSASAQVMIASVVEESPPGLDDVMNILDEASQIRKYSHELEAKSRELERATAELRAANEQLQELDRMKDDFISTVTHELRTPLTSIRAFSEMLHNDPRIELDDRKRFLGIIVEETERLSRLINQILDLAKMDSGRAEWTTGPLDVSEVVRKSTQSLEQLLADRGIRLTLQLPTRPLVVNADPDRLMQVLLNLLSNAAKFVAPGSGRIEVRAECNSGQVTVSVTDNGPGIRPEDREIIFEKFQQGGNTLTNKPEGTGLGLPISRKIIEHLGGHLWVEDAEEIGARFVFTLPLAER